jgi:cell wall-associated NlpC family hydrolase
MSHATLRVRLGVIAALTVLTTLVLGAWIDRASASTTTKLPPIAGPLTTLTSPSPTPTPTASDSASPTPTPSHSVTTKASSTHAPARKSLNAHQRMMKVHEEKVRKVLREARRQKGKPYVYGADGPHAFDCSGLVRYVFLHALHRALPHNAAAQYHSIEHIRHRALLPGDLVFVDNGGYISHVGIYAGHHHWWVAPHTGTRVKLQRIYPAHFVYGRVIRFRHVR